MLKLISTMARLTALVGTLAALPGMVAMQRKAMEQAGAAAAHGEDVSSLLGKSFANGQAPDSQGLNLPTSIPGVLSLLTGVSAGPSAPAPTPAQPATVIYRTGPDGNRGKADTAVMKLPPGASATFVDGRLQVYYPSGKPRTAR